METFFFFCADHLEKEARICALGRRAQGSRSQVKKKDKRAQEGPADPTTRRAISRLDGNSLFFSLLLVFLDSFGPSHWAAHSPLLVSNPRALFFCGGEGRSTFHPEETTRKKSGRHGWTRRVCAADSLGEGSAAGSSFFLLASKKKEEKRGTAICPWRPPAPKSAPRPKKEKRSFFSKERLLVSIFSLSLCFRTTWGGRWRQRRACQRCRCRPC